MGDDFKQAAVELDELGDKSLSEISAADFLGLLERLGSTPEPAQELGDVRVRDVVNSTGMALRFLPEKKKVELELPKRREGGGVVRPPVIEKKKIELEKFAYEMPKWAVELPQDPVPLDVVDIGDRLSRIEERLEQLGR